MLGELGFSGSLFRSLKWREGAILRNGSPVRAGAALREGDVLSVTMSERRAPSENISAYALPLEILYEDGALLVLNKPAGVPMHTKSEPGMAGALRAYLGDGTAAHFVNRLDQGTSGLCIAAKSGYIHDRFRAALHSEGLYREYRALACGCVAPPAGVIALPIGREDGKFYKYCGRPDGKPARTEYELLSHLEGLSFLRLIPRTGRTHQLRVHMAALGYPLAGDRLYGAAETDNIARPALHSYVLRFTHPLTGEKLEFTAPLPGDMAAFL